MGKSKVVVITGASAGVGRATAREFAKQGACIGLIARGREGLEAARAEVKLLGGDALVIQADVANASEVEAAAEKVESHFGPIDIWVNNAMTTVFSPIKEMNAEEFRRVTEVTYLGYVHGTLSALKRMLPRNKGKIIQVGSALAYRSIPLQSAYCAAKHAILGFTESLRTELLHDGSRVSVTMVQMPALNTPQFGWVKSRMPKKPQPVPPIFQPEVAARAIVWASKKKKREIYVGFSAVKAILADKFLPNLSDHYAARKGYKGQLTKLPSDPSRPSNLWQPVAGDHGAHGSFDKRARKRSWQFFFRRNRGWFLAAGVAALALATRDREEWKRIPSLTRQAWRGVQRPVSRLPRVSVGRWVA